MYTRSDECGWREGRERWEEEPWKVGEASDRSQMTYVPSPHYSNLLTIYVAFQNKLSRSIFYSNSKLPEYDTVLSLTLRSVTHCQRRCKSFEGRFILRTVNKL